MSEYRLLPDEQVLFEVEAALWPIGSNPIEKLIYKILILVMKILGSRRIGKLTVTTKRVIETTQEISCYCIPGEKSTTMLLPSSVHEVGYKMIKTLGMFCPSYVFIYHKEAGGMTAFEISGATEEQMKEYVTTFYHTIKTAR